MTGSAALGSGKFRRYSEARDGEKNGDEDRGQDTSHIGFLRPLYPEHYGALPGSFRILSSGSNLFVLDTMKTAKSVSQMCALFSERSIFARTGGGHFLSGYFFALGNAQLLM